jgi:hypothetical protein
MSGKLRFILSGQFSIKICVLRLMPALPVNSGTGVRQKHRPPALHGRETTLGCLFWAFYNGYYRRCFDCWRNGVSLQWSCFSAPYRTQNFFLPKVLRKKPTGNRGLSTADTRPTKRPQLAPHEWPTVLRSAPTRDRVLTGCNWQTTCDGCVNRSGY